MVASRSGADGAYAPRARRRRRRADHGAGRCRLPDDGASDPGSREILSEVWREALWPRLHGLTYTPWVGVDSRPGGASVLWVQALTDPSDADQAAERILETLGEPVEDATVTRVAAGLVQRTPAQLLTNADLLERADRLALDTTWEDRWAEGLAAGSPDAVRALTVPCVGKEAVVFERPEQIAP
ncbi:MAG: hypothetical protein GY913_33060 [Proteobacteria bacterium]|nr:hypothetical protein [Pseudomonadota bacterium]MCP4921755.1 hypothetical protein [Pseudomonadota bacterium]